ncbi:MAG TPA: DUF4097 family beta strand repeat-containing protein [Bryobacteraceae bacterium]|nr:DUF4097 family beta strand repeat-containing protein [Bryobacteraceae bacterium]
MKHVCTAAAFILVAGNAAAQDRVTVPLTDPAKPAVIRASLLSGSFSVRGYQGRDVIVEARGRAGESRRRREPEEVGGMRRIDMAGTGLDIEENNNVVRIRSGHHSAVEIDLQVPYNTSLDLKTVNNGGIRVENVNGEIDVNSLNGAIALNNVSGSVLAHCLNGPVTVTFDKLTGGKPMSFSSLNGNIDVTFPADVKANVKLKTENGDIYTDFEIAAITKPLPAPEKSGGRFRVRFDRAFYGSINGGGPEMQFTTLNGRILLRRKK